jgi:excisionase family DNA binding protein
LDFVNFEEAKKRLGKSDEELQGMIKRGDLRAFRDGGAWKFRKEDVDAKAGGPAAPAEGEKDAGDTLMSIDADILFAEEEGVPADSAAETWIAADAEGVFPGAAQATPAPEQPRGVEEAMSAPETEPAPLALSPETDESSLGAVLSDEELGGTGTAAPLNAEEEPVIAIDAESGLASVVPGTTSGSAIAPSRTRVVTLVEPPAHHGAFTFMLGLATVALGLAIFAMISFLTNGVPGWLVALTRNDKEASMAPLIIWISAAVVVGVAAGIGYYLDKQRSARESLGNI